MISVIISVYNIENSLPICLNSILRQTYKNFEIICVDDASTDSSWDILEYFSKKDSRVRIIKNTFRKGFGFSMNLGLKEADGDYVIFLNGNDWLRFNALKILINEAENCQLDLLFFNSITTDDHNNQLNTHSKCLIPPVFENKIFNHFDLSKQELFSLKKSIHNKFFSKSFLDENNIKFLNEDKFNIEIPFLLNAITSAQKISSINDELRISQENNTDLSNLNPERLFDCFDIIYSVFEIFLEDIQLYNYYKKTLLDFIFKKLNEKYLRINKEYKKRFFIEVQSIFRNLIKDYELHYDILNYVDRNILNTFRFDEVIQKIRNPPKTSIIIPVYNTEKDLPQVLDSIVNQSIGMENLEVIIIDDCSTDKSADIIEKYCEKYDNIVSFKLYENSGSPSKPRNIGIRIACSDYIMFHDSDDIFKIDACDVLYETMTDYNVDFISGIIMRNDNGDYELAYEPWNRVLMQYDEFKNENIEELLSSDKMFEKQVNSIDENLFVLADYSLNSKLFKKSFFKKNKIRFTEYLNGAEDSIVLFNCLIKSEKFVFINKVIFNYNVHRENSLTHNFSLKTIQSRPEAYQIMYDLAVLNNRKNLFVNVLLWGKLNYWIEHHLIVSHDVCFEDIVLIFKAHKLLFCECLTCKELPELLKKICEDIKNKSFEKAAERIMKKRIEYSNSLESE